MKTQQLAFSPSRPIIAQQLRELLESWDDASDATETPLLQITQPEAAARFMEAALYDLEQEELHILLLNTKNCVMRDVMLYRGTVNSVNIRCAEVFREAVRDNASSIILVHNHPSGDPTPSPEDVRFTRDVVAAGTILDIQVLDHIVVGRGRHLSLRKCQLGF